MPTEPESPQMDVYSGVRWSAAAAWGQQAIQFSVTIVLARLLMPQDYGLLAMATVFIGFLDIFSTMGFGLAVIQRREVNDALLSSLFYVNLAVGVLLALATVGIAPVCVWIYHEPRVLPLMAALSLNFVFSAPGVIPQSLLNRSMRFDRLAIVQLSTKIVGGALGIWLAASGWGVWALVWPTLFIGSATKTVLFHMLSGWRPRLIFYWSEVRNVWNFGANVTGFSVFNYFARNADNFIIGAFLGAGPLGFYSLAYSILLKPRDAVTNVLMRVLFPAFSRMQDDDARLKAAYLRACGAIAFITFPMMLGLMVVAHPFVQVVLGEKWLPAVPLIIILAPIGALQSVWVPVGPIFLVKNRTDWYFRMGVAQGCIMVIAFLAGIPWGATGVAFAYAIVNLFWIPIWIWLAGKLVIGLHIRDFVNELLPYGLLSFAMCLAVLLCRHLMTIASVAAPIVLAVCVAVGVSVYIISVFVIQPVALADLARILPTGWIMKFLRPGTATPGNTVIR